MGALVHPCYFGPISQFVVLAKEKDIVFEIEDNYQKQTYRNRMVIYGANGTLQLNIPIKHTKENNGKQTYKEIPIENNVNWQTQHWRSLVTAYKTSPFFEYYEDELYPLFHEKQESLLAFNFNCLKTVLACLQLDIDFNTTLEFEKIPSAHQDFRHLVKAKQAPKYNLTHYNQVFEDRHGHVDNLCILDLLFNEGPNALLFLEQQEPITPILHK